MRKQFDIKYRPQIESGEYKVILDCGVEAEILAWDKPGAHPIVCMAKKEGAIPFRTDNSGIAYHYPEGSNYSDLFLIIPEPKLTEFEKAFADVIGYAISQSVVEPNYETYKFVKDWSEKLLDVAKKELCKGCAANLEGYIKGRQDASKEMEENRVYKYEGPAIPTYFPPCFLGGPCTNPMHDCINCPRQSTVGINTATGTSTAKVEGQK